MSRHGIDINGTYAEQYGKSRSYRLIVNHGGAAKARQRKAKQKRPKAKLRDNLFSLRLASS